MYIKYMSKTQAYTAASGGFPIKIFKNIKLLSSIIDHNIIQPVHLQLNPTNKCNLNCSFCSCSEREKSLQLSKEQLENIFINFRGLGCRSVTITGGGEPLLWKEAQYDINWVISEALRCGIEVGLVTNGYLLNKLRAAPITWVRISASDESDTVKLFKSVDKVVNFDIDWSFSYVITDEPNTDNIFNIIKYANEHNFTHVRMVNDILKPVADLKHLSNLIGSAINDNIVIWQDRKQYAAGTQRCLISLLKPVVGADGLIYPCCGTQYAQAVPDRDCSSVMVMGDINNLDDIWSKQNHYDGSGCIKCYYSNYNNALANLIDDVDHRNFV